MLKTFFNFFSFSKCNRQDSNCSLKVHIHGFYSYFSSFSGVYYKPKKIVNDDSRVISELEASLTDDARVIIYDYHMLTGGQCYKTFFVRDL